MIDVIIAEDTRPASGDDLMNLYSAGAVAAALAHQGMDVRLVDLMPNRGQRPFSPTEKTADIVCYSVFFGNKSRSFSYIEAARRSINPPRLIIAFGPFAGAFPEEVLNRGLADIVIAHDPEFVIPSILKSGTNPAEWAAIPNLSYKHDGKIIHTAKHSFHDLDAVGLISPYLYTQGYRPVYIMAARGCQHHCIYCDRNALWGGGVRSRSIDRVLAEIKDLVEVHGAKDIRFLDEDLAANQEDMLALCKGMFIIKGEFTWQCCACIDSVNQKMLLLMASAGCRNIFFGMESASTDVLRRVGKKYNRQEILNAVRWSKAAGIKTEVMITLGNPSETELDWKLTLTTIKEFGSGINIVRNRLVILPGTPFYRKGLQKGWYTPQSFFEDDGLVFYDEKERGES